MSGRYALPTITTSSMALAISLLACTDETPTQPTERPQPGAASVSTASFGPFPGSATIFVDVANTTGVEDGTRSHPFRTIRRGLASAKSGSVVGVAAGLYANEFGTELAPQYVIDGLKGITLHGSGAKRTTLRGNHGFSLIRVQDGASVTIKELTIEEGGDPNHSEGGGIQVLGGTDSVSLTVQDVVLRKNQAVNGAAIAAEGTVHLRLVNVLVADNTANNAVGGIYLNGIRGPVTAALINSTVTGNGATFFAGGIGVEYDVGLRMINSIVWNNALAEIGTNPNGQSVITVSHSDIGERLYPGDDNISADPRFNDPSIGNYRLTSKSPAIDAGRASGAPGTDILRKPRPIDGNGDCVAKPDMGAYEFGALAGC